MFSTLSMETGLENLPPGIGRDNILEIWDKCLNPIWRSLQKASPQKYSHVACIRLAESLHEQIREAVKNSIELGLGLACAG